MLIAGVSWNKESDSFKADPPNATLSILGKVDETNVMVELTSVEQKRGSVVFKVAVLEGKVIEPFKEASLFIDQNTNIETSGVL